MGEQTNSERNNWLWAGSIPDILHLFHNKNKYMKILKLLSVLLVILCISCKDYGKEVLEGKHELRRFDSYTHSEDYDRTSAGFFLFFGSYKSEKGTYSEARVKFAWKDNNGAYVISSLPISRIRVNIDSLITTPYVTFKSQNCKGCNDEYYVDLNPMTRVVYMTVYCKEEDFPYRVNINSL